MPVTIQYNNEYDIPITLEQLKQFSEFKKLYLIDNAIKKIEHYVNNEIIEVQYYKSETENINEIFSSLDTNTVTLITIQDYNKYTIKSLLNYSNEIISSTEKYLLLNNKIICKQEFDSNGILDIAFSAKYMYDTDGYNIGEEIFSFHYKQDGTLNYISGIGFPFSDDNQTIDSNEILIYFPDLLKNNPYYINATFLPEQ